MADKPKKPRRVPVNSTAGVAAAMVAGGKKIAIPSHVTLVGKERLIFTEICDELSKSELSAHKITLIASLAQQLASLDQEQVLLRREGTVLTNSHGNPIANPRVKVCTSLTNSMLALRRSLGVHARELAGGDNRRTAIMRSHNMANETVLDDIDPDNLLARPNVVPIRPQEVDDDG